MNKIAYIIASLFLAIACNNNQLLENPIQLKGAFQLKFRVDQEELAYSDEPATKAPSNVDETSVEDVWTFQFAGTDENSVFVGSPTYIDFQGASHHSIPYVESEGAIHRLVFIANTADPNLVWNLTPGISTYADLLKANIKLQNEVESYKLLRLLMSGTYIGKIDADLESNPPTINLTRTVAKVELNLSLATTLTGCSITSVQLQGIPSYLNYTDALHSSSSVTAPYPNPTEVKTFDYPAVTTNMPTSSGEVKTFQWYVPRNMQGTVVNSLRANKTAMMPPLSTRIVITMKDEKGLFIIYSLCPGANMTNDFNLIPNHKYSLSLKIIGKGDAATDSRIEDFGNVNYVGKPLSNCYMLNPPPTGSAPRTYTIPVVQVDRFWGDAQYVGAGNHTQNILGTDKPWTVRLYWTDTKDMLSATNSTTDIYFDKKTGSGKNDFFQIVVPATAKQGNMVVAISRDDMSNTVLWTWHFWVTDYNPYYKGIPIANTFAYKVQGGEVHRYNGIPWQAGGELASKFIMDRNLGTLRPNINIGVNKGALFYQFGRKDPIPGNYEIYNASGTKLSNSTDPKWNNNSPFTTSTSSTTTLSWSINNPMTFITSDGQWVGGPLYNASGGAAQTAFDNGTNGITLRTWHDPKIASIQTGANTKSIFDPCPQGWKVPRTTIWSDFTSNTDPSAPTTNIGGTIRGFPDFRNVTFGAGMHYWPYIKIALTIPVNGTIFYPLTGYRVGGTASITTTNTNGYCRTSIPSNITNVNNLYFAAATLTTNHGTARSLGLPVRCVQE